MQKPSNSSKKAVGIENSFTHRQLNYEVVFVIVWETCKCTLKITIIHIACFEKYGCSKQSTKKDSKF